MRRSNLLNPRHTYSRRHHQHRIRIPQMRMRKDPLRCCLNHHPRICEKEKKEARFLTVNFYCVEKALGYILPRRCVQGEREFYFVVPVVNDDHVVVLAVQIIPVQPRNCHFSTVLVAASLQNHREK